MSRAGAKKTKLFTKRGKETFFGHNGPQYSNHRNVISTHKNMTKKGTMVVPRGK